MADGKQLTKMEEALLPQDLLRRVLAKLLLRDRVRARVVCKLWNALLSSEEWQYAAADEEEPPWVCLHRSDGKMTVWYPGSKETFQTSPHTLFRSPSWCPDRCFASLLASSHGFILGLCKDRSSWVSPYRKHIMVLAHPFSGKWIKLPPFRHLDVQCASDLCEVLSPSHASMVVDPLDGSYKINVLLSKYANRVSAVYLSLYFDSSMHSFTWAMPEPSMDSTIDCSALPQGSLLALVMSSWIRVHDVHSGRCVKSLSLREEGTLSRLYCREYTHGDSYSLKRISYFRLGSYKGRCILIQALSEQWGYEVSELEKDAETEQMAWNVLSTFSTSICYAFGSYREWFVFEGDFLVAFSEKAVVAFNLKKLTWHCYQLPRGLTIEYKTSCVFTPHLTSVVLKTQVEVEKGCSG